jgi:hypothetical protein
MNGTLTVPVIGTTSGCQFAWPVDAGNQRSNGSWADCSHRAVHECEKPPYENGCGRAFTESSGPGIEIRPPLRVYLLAVAVLTAPPSDHPPPSVLYSVTRLDSFDSVSVTSCCCAV